MTPEELARHGLRVKPLEWDGDGEERFRSALNGDNAARIAAALEPIAPPDVAQAARVLPPNIIVRQAVTDDHAIAIRDLNAEDGGLEGVLVAKCDVAALIRCLRALLPEGGE